MAAAIHIEIDVLFLLILGVISWQITHSVSKQMGRILFRYVVYGNMFILALDILWMLIEGQTFPGAIMCNRVINGIYLGAVVVMGGVWYLYVLEKLGYRLTKKLLCIVLAPGAVFVVLNLLSIKTGWIFTISEDNHYVRGPLFFLQTIVALLILFASMVHILISCFTSHSRLSKQDTLKLLSFYIVPFAGSLAALPFAGMPGTWTCAAVSIILMYMDEQENAILRDSLTGLNNRKSLAPTFDSYSKMVTEGKNLYLFMLDLNKFKEINDTYGHTTGDKALVDASGLISKSMENIQGFAARYGGDEFLIMVFFADNAHARQFENQIRENFEVWNRENDAPYILSTCIGFSRYEQGQSLEDLVKQADENLYKEKHARL